MSNLCHCIFLFLYVYQIPHQYLFYNYMAMYLKKQCLNRLLERTIWRPPRRCTHLFKNLLLNVLNSQWRRWPKHIAWRLSVVSCMRSLKNDLAVHCNSKEDAHKRILVFKAHLAEKEKEKQDNQHESDSDMKVRTQKMWSTHNNPLSRTLFVSVMI